MPAIKPRTEDEILGKKPIKVLLGEKEYQIKLLTILKAEAWRETYVAAMNDIAKSLNVQLPTGALGAEPVREAFLASLTATMLRSPRKLLDLIFAYGPDLPKEEICDADAGATDEQIERAFSQIMQVAFPFLALLGTAIQMAKAMPQPSQSYTN